MLGDQSQRCRVVRSGLKPPPGCERRGQRQVAAESLAQKKVRDRGPMRNVACSSSPQVASLLSRREVCCSAKSRLLFQFKRAGASRVQLHL